MICDEVLELAPELALGIVAGDERADAVAHLAGCPACRSAVESFSGVADAVLLAAPEAEPTLGFEDRVLASLGPAKPRRRWIALGVAGAVAASLVGGIVVGRVASKRHETRLDREYVAALKVLGGSSLRAARLHDPSGTDRGEVFAYQGHPSWLFVEAADTSVEGAVVTADGQELGRLHVANGHASLGVSLVDVSKLGVIRVTRPDGTLVFDAVLGKGEAMESYRP
jgi:hypothetical protein